jgi:serine/threonine protein kinase
MPECSVGTERRRPADLTVIAATAPEDWLLEAIDAHERVLSENRGVLKNEHKTSITRVEVAGRGAVVKHYRYISVRFLLKSLFRRHPGRRSLRASQAMRERGIPTPEVIGLVERRRFGLVAESWLITRDLPGALEMDRYILRKFPASCDFHRRRRFVLDFARALDALMRSGVRHRDLKTCNVLVIERQDSWGFSFIDLDDVTVEAGASPARRDDWVLALAQLNPSTPKILPRTDRLRFLAALPEVERFDRRALIVEIQELSRKRRRAYFSDEGEVEMDFV